jgi:copper(I)-binding protein
VAILGLVAATCGGDAEPLAVSDVWSRASAAGQDTGVVYFEITGGPMADALVGVSVSTEIAAGAALHETVAADGTDTTMSHDMGGSTMAGHDMGDMGGGMTMRAVSTVAIDAGGRVTFEPGGYHVMLLGLVEPLVVGDTFEVTLSFVNAGDVVVVAEVRE